MDNLTHSLVGLTASKAGLESLSPATSVVCILVANAPDVDLVSGIFGDRWRAKITSTGTYAGNTSVSVRLNAR